MVKRTVFLMFVLFISFPPNAFAKTLLLVTLESPPDEYIDNGQPKGSNVEIVIEGLKRMGYDCKIRFVTWKRALLMVKNGTADGIIDAAYNKERAEYLHYPYEEIDVEEWYCFKRKESDFTLDKDLANVGKIRLGISRGFVYGGILQEAIDKKQFMSIEEVRNNPLNIKKLIRNRFDMFIGEKKNILFLAKKLGYRDRIEIVRMTGTDKDFLLSSSKTYLGFSKKNINKEIAEKFSKVIAEMRKDGTIDKISISSFL